MRMRGATDSAIASVAEGMAPEGVEVAVGSFEDAAALASALQGVEKAFLVHPGSEAQVASESAFVAAPAGRPAGRRGASTTSSPATGRPSPADAQAMVTGTPGGMWPASQVIAPSPRRTQPCEAAVPNRPPTLPRPWMAI